jgi:hypothetical protein
MFDPRAFAPSQDFLAAEACACACGCQGGAGGGGGAGSGTPVEQAV